MIFDENIFKLNITIQLQSNFSYFDIGIKFFIDALGRKGTKIGLNPWYWKNQK